MAKHIHWIGILGNEKAREAGANRVWDAPEGYVCRIEEPNRSLDQNATQFPYLEGFAQQKTVPINGVERKVSNEVWKQILTSCFAEEVMQFAVYNGKTILLPERTSNMGKKRFSLWLDWLIAEAANNGVTPVFKHEMQDLS